MAAVAARALSGPADAGRDADRRGSFRYKVEGLVAWLAWRGDGDAARPGGASARGTAEAGPLVREDVEILDVSQTGLCLAASRRPPPGRRLWIGLRDADPAAWFEITLRAVSEPKPGLLLLRATFVEGCPYDLIKHALVRLGQDPKEQAMERICEGR